MLYTSRAVLIYTMILFQTTAQSQFLHSYMFRLHIVGTIRQLLYYITYSYAVQHTHGVNTVYQNPGSPPGQTQEISNTVRCFKTNCYIPIFYVLKLHFYFNLIIFSNIYIYISTDSYIMLMYMCSPFPDIQYAACLFTI